ncbi:MAG: hypothetical protein LBU23_08700, partial [Planctomycetota bacterium]|nr:hypothetical protein [Planctomycetota bacterium]
MPNNPWAAAEKLNPVAGESQYKTLLRLAAERRRREEEERKRLEAEAEAKAAAGQEDDWEAEAEEIRRQNLAKMAEREEMERARATREVARQAIPLNVTPGDLPAAGLPEYNLNASEAAEVLAAMPVQERFDAAARIGGGLANSLSLLKKSGLPGAEEVESYARQTGISRNLVRDLLPHAKDELEARAMAKRLLDIYGDDPAAVDNSYLMNQVRLKPDSAYWLQPDMEAKARFEAALMSQRGGFLAGLTDNPTWKAIGKFADQQASRLWQGYKEIGRQNVKIVHGISSAAAGLAGAQSVKKWLDDIHREIQHLNPQTRIDTGNQAVDWLLDKAFIDAPNLYSQMAPYVILGKTYGWAARVAGMWGGELSDMLEADVPLAYALPWSAISAGLQSYIESAKIYPRFESLARGIANNPALQRPLAQWAIEGGIESLKQVPDEFLQNSVSKLMGDLGQLSASGDTEEFYRRLLSGWGEPIEGAATAGIASLFLMGAGAPAAARAHLRYRAKIAGVEQALTAAAADKQLAADPIRYKENIQPIIKNALTYNQATPAEVYIPAAKVDELAADPAERDRLLDIMGAREEYRRSKATGAVMAIKLEGYVAAIANHAKRGEWQKWIQVDLDGPDSQQAEKAEETQKRIQAEADELVRQIRGLAGGGEALPPELEVLRGDLRQI